MKNLILFLVLFIPFTLFAQDKVNSADTNDQTDVWMTKISSNSEMRSKMMNLMLEKTNGDETEMTKLMNSILINPEMNRMIFAANSGTVENENKSIEPRGIMFDSDRVEKIYLPKPDVKK